MSTTENLKIAVLFSRLSGYMSKCLRVLCERHNVDILVFRKMPAEEAPFDAEVFEWINELYNRKEFTAKQIYHRVEQFGPNALFISGWEYADYLKVARAFKKGGVPVIAGSDRQWKGSIRQQVGRVIAPWYLQSAIDVLWVAGERQRQLADRLGYRGPYCWSGYYACDWKRFARAHPSRSSGQNAFLFVGRYVAEKGLEVLVEAYSTYRQEVDDPWSLICAGTGPKRPLLTRDGIIDKGFLQPDKLPNLMKQGGAFVLPSRHEPWGVVLQEAAAAGLPLICSEACGASVHLLQDGYNGFLFETGNTEHLTRCMIRMGEAETERRERMAERSHELSQLFTPQRWADTLIEGITQL
jgi:glycosyltransferase involved in cell wall biosynthesis